MPATPLTFPGSPFRLLAPFPPAGDQEPAVEALCAGLRDGLAAQTLLGVTGSGKTYVMAQVIARTGVPALVMAPNKTLAAQLYGEMRGFFPDHAVEYFVSYYDYYQPEAYLPARDLFIEKDSSLNELIEQMRLSATKSVLERRDTIVVATVSAIYGIGDPASYTEMRLILRRGDRRDRADLLAQLARMRYERDERELMRGRFRIRGETIDIFPAEHSELALRVELLDDTVEALSLIDPLTGRTRRSLTRFVVYPASHYALPREDLRRAIGGIRQELDERLSELARQGRTTEADRLRQRTLFDLELLDQVGFCKGIENYSRHLSGRAPGEPPPCLIDYLPADALMFFDESHVLLGQLAGMYRGDRSRKETLVRYGFRLPSALDNRPLRFDELEDRLRRSVFVSATPAEWELARSSQVVELVVRPTGLVDPRVEVRPARGQVEDLLAETRARVAAGERVLVTALTKRMAEELTDFLGQRGVRARYLHSDIDAVERAEIIRDLRAGAFDVLVGINLLREGLDLPEVSLVAVLDADKEGFLRSTRSLIQTIGRAARHLRGTALLYADQVTDSMARAIDETERRRRRQEEYNREHHVTPRGVVKEVRELIEGLAPEPEGPAPTPRDEGELARLMRAAEQRMRDSARDLDFEAAARHRDELRRLKRLAFGPAAAAESGAGGAGLS